jgi:hypothetical protein
MFPAAPFLLACNGLMRPLGAIRCELGPDGIRSVKSATGIGFSIATSC